MPRFAKNEHDYAVAPWRAWESPPESRCRFAAMEGRLLMETRTVEELGNEIAELAAHLDAATARLLDLIREFDARDGWNNDCSSCAHWLSWRVGLDLGAARERVRVALALPSLPRLAERSPVASCRTPRCARSPASTPTVSDPGTFPRKRPWSSSTRKRRRSPSSRRTHSA
jgi:hypothetical protein